MQKKIRQVFIAGLAVTIPIGLTLYVFFFLISVMDRLLDFIPQQYHPDTIFPFHIPGLGVIATIILIFLCGVLMKSYIGHRIVGLGEMLFYKIPIIRSIYEGTKQIVDSLFVNKTRSFQKVVLVPFSPSRVLCPRVCDRRGAAVRNGKPWQGLCKRFCPDNTESNLRVSHHRPRRKPA